MGVIEGLGFRSYRDYLASPLWRRIKGRVLWKKRKGSWRKARCRICRGMAVTVHHRSYEREVMLGKNRSKLVPMCRHCHKFIEFDDDGRKRPLHEANRELDRLVGLGERPIAWEDRDIITMV